MVLYGYRRVKGVFYPEIVGHGCIIAKSNNHPTGARHGNGLNQLRGFMCKFVDQLLRAKQAYARKHRESDLQQILFIRSMSVVGITLAYRNAWNKILDVRNAMVHVLQIEKAKWGKCFALPHMHREYGLLHDTLLKDAGQKTQQTAFGRLVAICNVWWFRPEMGGLAGIINCETFIQKNMADRDDSTPYPHGNFNLSIGVR